MTDLPVPDDLRRWRDAAIEIAVAAGRFAQRGRAAGGVGHVDTKSSSTDPVTEWDRATEAMVVDELTRRFPDDGLVGEEGTGRVSSSGRWWWIDPIDGTTNFVYGLPGWAVSIAVGDQLHAYAGAVYVPATDEVFAAARGLGATLDGAPLHHSGADDVRTALVATGFAYDRERRGAQGTRIATVLPAVRDVRRLGAASVDLCHVAAGRVDAYFEDGLGPWDVAAGVLVAEEAGCTVTDFAGGPWGPHQVLAAAPGVHTAMVELLGPFR
jgi:myo-inositol-1(or 4)-monophosphatase